MKQHLAWGAGLLGGVAGALVAQAPVWSAPTTITGVQVNQTGAGMNIMLATEKGDRPQVFTINTGNTFTATIINTQLRLPQGNTFRQENPAPGIASIEINQLDANSIRIMVAGTTGSPSGQVVQGQGSGIVLNIAQGRASAANALPQTIPSQSMNSAAPPPSMGSPLSQAAPPPPPGSPLSQAAAPPPQTRPSQPSNVLVPNPPVTITRNGQVPLPQEIQSPINEAPPFLPRAVAPPLGDIAVSNIAPSGASIDLGTGERIPRLVLRDAPVRDVLALLARAAGLNIAFTGTQGQTGQPGQPGQPAQQGQAGGDEGPKISLDIENESVQDVFNYVLRLSGLQANRLGRTIFVGSTLPLDSRNIIMRTLRLNQVRAADAANFLSAQGAETQLPITRVTIQTVGQGNSARDVEIREPDIKAIGAKEGVGPLLLRGLSVLADTRLNSITLVGEPRKVDVAVALLTQLDLRRRQVAVNVKVVDVNLAGANNYSSSFSFGVNDSFFVNDNGAAVVNFGGINPPNASTTTGGIANPAIIPNRDIPQQDRTPFYDASGRLINVPLTAPGGGLFIEPIAPITNNPNRVGISDYTTFERDLDTGALSSLGEATFSLFPLFQYPRRFLSLLQANIVSGNAKILTDPTLVVQEGERADVNLTQEVVTNVTVQTNATSGGLATQTVTAQKGQAGLVLTVEVDRIDDNGFVSLRVNPVVRAPLTDRQLGNNTITLLQERSLQSGLIRLRDGQTLIVSGIIQDTERTNVSKIPILGDLPIIGSLFRSTNKRNERAEVIVLLTPRILDDSDRSSFGYQYNVSPDVRQMLQRSAPVQPR